MSHNPYTPPAAPLEDPQPGRYELASRRRRLANHLIDIGCCNLVVALLATSVAGLTGRDIDTLVDGAQLYAFAFAGVLLYYTSCESLTGRTLGKMVTRTRTVTVSGHKPSFERILLRTLVRLVPLEPLSFLASEPIGWHDRWSGTRVVRI
jgi:uncharacterized RDD family membrane protein YckC